MKLTRKQVRELETALHDARRARAYIMAPHVAVAHRSKGTTTLDYTRADGAALYEVEREYGSDLCGLDACIARLERFLSPDPSAT